MKQTQQQRILDRLKEGKLNPTFDRVKNLGEYSKPGAVPWNKGVPNSGFKKGYTPWNKGKRLSLETRSKMSKSRKGVKHFAWKGDAASYSSNHMWVRSSLPKTDTCSNCGKSGLYGHKIHWANVDHKYRRVLEDYVRLCVSCHRRYDYNNNLCVRKVKRDPKTKDIKLTKTKR